MKKKGALIVATEDRRLKACARLVRRAGYDVVACRSYEEARQALATRVPDALLTDLRLGNYNGLHLVLVARTMSQHTASVVFSGEADVVLEPEVARCGAHYMLEDKLNEELAGTLRWLSANADASISVDGRGSMEALAHHHSFD